MGGEKGTASPEPALWLSMLQHYAYCPRQCALIHLEEGYEENIYTLQGNFDHERVHTDTTERCGDTVIEKSLPIWSDRYGLVGQADTVEFRPTGPYPVEYKHGRKRNRTADNVHVCAQALCLEEMFGAFVAAGAIYHCESNRRREVEFTTSLRERTIGVIEAVRRLLIERKLPPPLQDGRCEKCSIKGNCMSAEIQIMESKNNPVDQLFEI